MPIIHRYLDELYLIEQEKVFCNNPINKKSNILIIGTFNPSDNSCVKVNDAQWFYGRHQNKFWKYLPMAITGESLHASDGHTGYPDTWRSYCVRNKIVIVDLIKHIDVDDVLPNFGDRFVDCKINQSLNNVSYINIRQAFESITFEKVIYSLSWSDKQILKMKIIRDRVNQSLIEVGSIRNYNQIKYCLTPSRNDAFQSWLSSVR